MTAVQDLANELADLKAQVAILTRSSQMGFSTVETAGGTVGVADAVAATVDTAAALPVVVDQAQAAQDTADSTAGAIDGLDDDLTVRFDEASADLDEARAALDDAQRQIDDAFDNLDGLSTDVSTAITAAGTAERSAEYARDLAAQAQTTADSAATQALSAAGIANGKGKLIVQVSAPTGGNAVPENLWFDISTNSGGVPKNQANRYNPSTSKWEPITDQKVVDAATAAAAAQQTATAAGTAAATADGKAVAAQSTANTAVSNAATAQAAADAARARADVLVAQAVNVILDPGFEDPTLRPSMPSRFVFATDQKHSGARSVKVGPLAAGTVQGLPLVENVVVQPGQVWRARVWRSVTSDYNGTSANGKLRLGDQAGGFLADAQWTTVAAWQCVELTYTVPASGVTTMTLVAFVNHSVGTIWFDDVELKNITDAKQALDAAAAAQTTANTAQQTANTANQAAAAANTAALAAAGIANGKGTVYAQISAPAVVDANGLWIDTDDGNAPYQGADYGPAGSNLATDPQARANAVESALAIGGAGWVSRWFGNGGAGTNTTVTGRTDGPVPGVTSFARKTWTTVGANVQDIGWSHTRQQGATPPVTQALQVTGGTTVSFASYVRPSRTQPAVNASNRMVLQSYASDGSLIATHTGPSLTEALTAGKWTRYAHTVTLPANAVYLTAYTQVYLDTWQAGDTLDGTALLVRAGALTAYYDGSFLGTSWKGTPFASGTNYAGPSWVRVQDQAIVAAAKTAGDAALAAAAAQGSANTAQQTANNAGQAAAAAQTVADQAQQAAAIAAAKAVAAAANTTNVLANPGAEFDFDSWDASARNTIVVQTVNVRTGAKAWRVTGGGELRQGMFPVNPGEVWRMRMWSWTTATAGASINGGLRLQRSNQASGSTDTGWYDAGSTGQSATTGWTLQEVIFTVPATGVTHLRARVAWAGNGFTVDFDDIELSNITDAKNAADAAAVAKTAADAAKGAADAAKVVADAAKTAAATADGKAVAAQGTADQAKTNAATAQSAADAANSAALSAAGIANGKGKLIVQVSAPTGANAVAENLWFDISGTPPKNQPNRWNSSSSKWEPITDQKVVDAATAAATAQSTASSAATAASTAQSTADAAKAAAGTAQSTADAAKAAAASAQSKAEQASTDALTATGLANGKGKVIYQSTAPTGANAVATNLWIRTTDNTPWTYNGSTWVQVTDKTATDAAAAAAAANTAAGVAKSAADAAQSTADGRPLILFSTAGPSGNAPTGSTWFQVNTAQSVIGQWQNTGTATAPVWTARPITSEVIANLDLGKLTAGNAAIADLVAQKIAASTANFQTVNVGNLFVTSGATMQQAVIDYLFAKVVQAKKITADMIDVNTLNGITLTGLNITGSYLRTAPASDGRFIRMSGSDIQFTIPRASGTTDYTAAINQYATSYGKGALTLSATISDSDPDGYGLFIAQIGGKGLNDGAGTRRALVVTGEMEATQRIVSSRGYFASSVTADDVIVRGKSIVQQDTGWVKIAVPTGFSNPEGDFAYRVIGNVVRLQGHLNRTAGQFPAGYTAVLTLPVVARPSSYVRIATGQYNGFTANVVISVAGNLSIGSNGNSADVYLGGISYTND